MKTLKVIIAVVVAGASASAAYADSGSHTPAQIFSNQTERIRTAPASEAKMPAPRSGWNKGSQYGVEWLTQKTGNRSETSSTNTPTASTEQPVGKNCDLKPRMGFNQQNNFERMHSSPPPNPFPRRGGGAKQTVIAEHSC